MDDGNSQLVRFCFHDVVVLVQLVAHHVGNPCAELVDELLCQLHVRLVDALRQVFHPDIRAVEVDIRNLIVLDIRKERAKAAVLKFPFGTKYFCHNFPYYTFQVFSFLPYLQTIWQIPCPYGTKKRAEAPSCAYQIMVTPDPVLTVLVVPVFPALSPVLYRPRWNPPVRPSACPPPM